MEYVKTTQPLEHCAYVHLTINTPHMFVSFMIYIPHNTI